MSGAANLRRAVALQRPGADPPAWAVIGRRPIYQFWHLLAPHFRAVLLAPQRRPDGGYGWNWQDDGAGGPPTAAELAELRQQLRIAEHSFTALATDPPWSQDPEDASGPLSLGGKVKVAARALVAQFGAASDAALAGYVCRTESGLMLHSWGATFPAPPCFLDAIEHEIGGAVFLEEKPGAGLGLVLENLTGASGARTRTDAAGRFLFRKVSSGDYRIRVEQRGDFPTTGFSVSVEQDSVYGLELRRGAAVATFSRVSSRAPFASTTPPEVFTAAPVEARRPPRRRLMAWVFWAVCGVGGLTGSLVLRRGYLPGGNDPARRWWQSAAGPALAAVEGGLVTSVRGGGARFESSDFRVSRPAGPSTLHGVVERRVEAPKAETTPAKATAEGKQTPGAVPYRERRYGPSRPASPEGAAPENRWPVSSEAPVAGESPPERNAARAKFPVASALAFETGSPRVTSSPPPGRRPSAANRAATASGSLAGPATDGGAADVSTVASPSIAVGGVAPGGVRALAANPQGAAGAGMSESWESTGGVGASGTGAALEAAGGGGNSAGEPLPRGYAGAVSRGRGTGNARSVGPPSPTGGRVGAGADEGAPDGVAADRRMGSGVARGVKRATRPSGGAAAEAGSDSTVAAAVGLSDAAEPTADESATNPSSARGAEGRPGRAVTRSGSARPPEVTSATEAGITVERHRAAGLSSARVASPRPAVTAANPSNPGETTAVSGDEPVAGKPMRVTAPLTADLELTQRHQVAFRDGGLRLLRDAILPTQPTPVGRSDTIETLRRRLRDEQDARIPAGFRQAVKQRGLVLEVPMDGRPVGLAPRWVDATGAPPAGATVQGGRAELVWSAGSAAAAAAWRLVRSDGREVAYVARDAAGEVTMRAAAAVRIWVWVGVEVGVPVTAPEWRTREGASLPPAWPRMEAGPGGSGIQIPLGPGGRGKFVQPLAWLEPLSGWALTFEVTWQ